MFTFSLTDGICIGWGWLASLYAVGYLIALSVMMIRHGHHYLGFFDYFSFGIAAFIWPVFAPFIIVGRVLHLILRRLRLI